MQISILESELTTLTTNFATSMETSTSRRDESLQKVYYILSSHFIFATNVLGKVFKCNISAEKATYHYTITMLKFKMIEQSDTKYLGLKCLTLCPTGLTYVKHDLHILLCVHSTEFGVTNSHIRWHENASTYMYINMLC